MSVLEVAELTIRQGAAADFEAAFRTVAGLVTEASGCLGAELRVGIEDPTRYVFLVRWDRIEDHVDGFANTDDFQAFLAAIGPSLAADPVVNHYQDSLLA